MSKPASKPAREPKRAPKKTPTILTLPLVEDRAGKIRQLFRNIEQSDRKNLRRAIELGNLLIQEKESCIQARKPWGPRQEELGIPQQRASEFVALAKAYKPGGLLPDSGDLTLSESLIRIRDADREFNRKVKRARQRTVRARAEGGADGDEHAATATSGVADLRLQVEQAICLRNALAATNVEAVAPALDPEERERSAKALDALASQAWQLATNLRAPLATAAAPTEEASEEEASEEESAPEEAAAP
jgi:hypothetical protein